MQRIGVALLCAVAAYLIGAFGGGALVSVFSTNQDKSVEAAMTGAFFFGPLAAVIGFVIGFMRPWARHS